MGWTTPRIWVAKEKLTAALLNIHLRDNLVYLKDLWVDDTPENGATTTPVSSNWAYDHVDAADPHTGYRLESADHTHQSTGLQAGKLDHGAALNGLGDNDHTQYILHTEVDDIPVNGVTTDPISSNWAYDTKVNMRDAP
ncbi:unnamed protein product, partial [marine sediment metagenome]